MMMHQQRGYILFITFSMLALCSGLVTLFISKGFAHKRFMQIVSERQMMQQFTRSNLALAQSFLSFSLDDIKNGQDEKQQNKNEAAEQDKNKGLHKKILEKILPVVNKTQTFMMKELVNDFPVVINLTFFAESGKININGLYDLVNKKFYDEGIEGKDKKVFATWLFDTIAKKTGKPSLLQPFVEHMQQRKIPFNDVTQLLEIKEFKTVFDAAIFYQQEIKKNDDKKQSAKLFLTDLFTVCSESDRLQPWLLSRSVCVLLDIVQQDNQQNNTETKDDKKIDLSSFKEQADWKKDWDVHVKPLYAVAYDKLPQQVRSFFEDQFTATVFSIMVTVAKQLESDQYEESMQMYAILKEKKLPDDSISYDVIKIYQV